MYPVIKINWINESDILYEIILKLHFSEEWEVKKKKSIV